MPARALFWLLLPLSALQGLWLRRIALRLPGAAGPRSGVVGQGPVYELLAVGDSIIDGVGTGRTEHSLPVQFATQLAGQQNRSVRWRVEGLSGRTIDDVLECMGALETQPQPDLVLISVGVNDVTALRSTRVWRDRMNQLIQTIRRRWPSARILFAGLPPMARFPLPPQPLRFSLGLRAATLDRIAQEVIDRYPNALHVPTCLDPEHHDFCEDGFHPSAESCTLWASELALIESRSEQ